MALPIPLPAGSGPDVSKKRKFLLALPLMISPMLFCMFFAFGGGVSGKVTVPREAGMFNTTLPAPQLKKDHPLNKLNYYQQADIDSLKKSAWLRQDPYRNKSAAYLQDTPDKQPFEASPNQQDHIGRQEDLMGRQEVRSSQQQDYNSPHQDYDRQHQALMAQQADRTDRQADSLLQQLEQLRQNLASVPVRHTPSRSPFTHNDNLRHPVAPLLSVAASLPFGPSTNSQSALESRISPQGAPLAQRPPLQFESDPQLAELNTLLDKLIRVQQHGDDAPLTNTTPHIQEEPSPDANAIPAVILTNQVLVNGGTLAMRATSAARAGQVFIPKNQLLYGIATISNSRMTVHITSFRNSQSIYSTSLQVYDMDGLPGIAIPNGMSREVAKQSADMGINEMNLTPYDPSIGAQIAGAGVQAAKSLFSRKVRQVRVFVRGGYQLLLRSTGEHGNAGRITLYPDSTLASKPGTETSKSSMLISPLTPSSKASTAISPPTPAPIPSPHPTTASSALISPATDTAVTMASPSMYEPGTDTATNEQPSPAGMLWKTTHRVYKQGKMALILTGVTANRQGIWLRLMLRNRSSIEYNPAYARCFLRDKASPLRSAIQESPLTAGFNTMPEIVPPHETKEWLLELYDLGSQGAGKEVVIELTGAHAGPQMRLTIPLHKLLENIPQPQTTQ